MNRRMFIQSSIASSLLPSAIAVSEVLPVSKRRYEISLSQWGFHLAILGDSKKDYEQFKKTLHSNPDDVLQGHLDPRDIVVMARQLGVTVVDLVNTLWFGHAKDSVWLNDFKLRARNEGVRFGLLMCDETGKIGANTKRERKQAIENHFPWLEAAAELGCKQVRVNAYGDGTYLEQLQFCSESLNVLAEEGKQYEIQLLAENHGYASNNGAWMAMLIEMSDHKNCGLFTDLDNFFMGGWNIEPERRYDRTQGLIDMAPYTKGVSAKSYDFDKFGQEIKINYKRCLDILLTDSFDGTVSAEYEGHNLSEFAGSEATVKLLKKMQYS